MFTHLLNWEHCRLVLVLLQYVNTLPSLNCLSLCPCECVLEFVCVSESVCVQRECPLQKCFSSTCIRSCSWVRAQTMVSQTPSVLTLLHTNTQNLLLSHTGYSCSPLVSPPLVSSCPFLSFPTSILSSPRGGGLKQCDVVDHVNIDTHTHTHIYI